jgi:CubicO group peptidase (beta-lactamase class C family)
MEHTINPRKIDARLIAGVLAVSILVVLLALVRPRLREGGSPAKPDYWPTDSWRTSAPEAQGLDSDKLSELLLTIREQNIPVHSLLIIRDGYVVTDATFYPYDGQTVHDVASVTKSVMTTLIGIAADQGKLDLDDTMLSFFPGRTIANLDERKERITVRHLASMSSGLACTRDGLPGNTNDMMQASPDFVQFVLDLPVAWEPGEHFVYCSPPIHLLSPILEQATGMTALEFARQYLFKPLHIQDAMWEQDPQGYYDGWGDLSLHPRDMAKLGFLFLHEGQWDGQHIVSRQWVREAGKQQIVAPDGSEDGYGYGWWMAPDTEGGYRADGRLGQYIYVLPAWNMVVVTTGGGFDIDDIAEPLLASFADFEQPLPENPEAVARLQETVVAVSQPPAAGSAASLPAIAQAISGKRYLFDPNPAQLDRVAFTFAGPAEATGDFAISGYAPMSWSIGLDGLYRFSPGLDGRPLALRGAWNGPETFVVEYNGVSFNDQMVMQFHFQGDTVTVTVGETAGGPGVQAEGRLEQP